MYNPEVVLLYGLRNHIIKSTKCSKNLPKKIYQQSAYMAYVVSTITYNPVLNLT